MLKLDEKLYKKMLKDICNCNKEYCLLRELCCYDPRTLIQSKCIEIYKWNESKKANKDIGFDAAGELWVKNGYAEEFAKIYDLINIENDYISPIDLYKKITKEQF